MHIQSWKDEQTFSEERFTKQELFSDKNHTVFVLNFRPGQALPSHRHPGKVVFLLVLQGHGDCHIDHETFSLSEGDFLHLDADNALGFTNNSDQPLSISVTLHNIPKR